MLEDVAAGVHDLTLDEFGDRAAAMLREGLGSAGDDSVFGRSFAVLVLAACAAQRTRIPGHAGMARREVVVRGRDVRDAHAATEPDGR
ncbi:MULTISPECIES: hypothetical protein [Microbacterium]|uniref:hypothetical protein n=1 Tax=Microbacterium TaxID=33882 RepID=UPI00217DDD70|nr:MULTISPECIES: hypothetical protein [Microbacterium]UWF78138.1 hypothetical protein JSY13_03660 [Microbacterium neungamense]WCM56315.1 hypothetical protein JRG78_03680 [Microbacterium sp. EF45047]